jgi:hypothetical protein
LFLCGRVNVASLSNELFAPTTFLSDRPYALAKTSSDFRLSSIRIFHEFTGGASRSYGRIRVLVLEYSYMVVCY